MLRLFPEPCVCQMMPPRSSRAAPWLWVRPSCRRCDRFVNSAKLLVAGNYLARLTVDLLENSEVTYQIEQMLRPQHAGRENLRCVEQRLCCASVPGSGPIFEKIAACQRVPIFRSEGGELLRRFRFVRASSVIQPNSSATELMGQRARVRPFEISLRWSADGRRARFEEVAGDQNLIGMEEPLYAFVLAKQRRKNFASLVRIAQELIDGFLKRVLYPGLLNSATTNGMPFTNKHGVGDDVSPSAGQLDFELVNNQEIIVGWSLEIDKLYRLRPPDPNPASRRQRALEQQFRSRLVNLHEAVARSLLEIANCPRDACLV